MRAWRLVALLASALVMACDQSPVNTVDPPSCSRSARYAFVLGDVITHQESGTLFGLTDDGRVERIVDDELAFDPDLSPDGSQIVFQSGRRLGCSDAGCVGAELYIVDLVDGSERRVTTGHDDSQPSWSPDGRWIVFVRDYATKRAGIFKVRPDGSALQRLIRAPEPLRTMSPTWSPDGKRIAWIQDDILSPYNDGEIWVASSQGLGGMKVASLQQLHHLAWSPDGSTLAASPGPGNAGIYMLHLASGEFDLIRQGADGPSWSPDGSTLIYLVETGEHGEGPHMLTERDLSSGRETVLWGDGPPVLYSYGDYLSCELGSVKLRLLTSHLWAN
jgi:Tol biopolymer transport system component